MQNRQLSQELNVLRQQVDELTETNKQLKESLVSTTHDLEHQTTTANERKQSYD